MPAGPATERPGSISSRAAGKWRAAAAATAAASARASGADSWPYGMPRPPPTSIRRGSSACSSQNSPEPAHHALEHAGVVDLRAEVHVQAAPVEVRVLARLDAGPGGLGRREAELGAGVRRRDLRVPAGEDARRHAHRDRLAPAVPLGRGGDARALVERVEHDEAAAGGDGRVDVGVGLAVAVHDDAGRIDARAQRRRELPGARDVGSETALAEQPQHADRAAGLAGERDVGVRMPRRRRPGRPARARAAWRRRRRRAGCRSARASSSAAMPPIRSAPPWLSAVAGQGEPSAVTNAPRRASPRCAT